MPDVPWWGWEVLAAIIGLAELHFPGSYLVWIAIGAAVTGAADAAWGLTVAAQIGGFAVASALSCGGGYFVYRGIDRHRREDTPLNQRNRAMVGARGVVCEEFVNGRGKVRLGDSVWLAQGPDLGAGTLVVVRSVSGTSVVVDVAETQKKPGAAAGAAAT